MAIRDVRVGMGLNEGATLFHAERQGRVEVWLWTGQIFNIDEEALNKFGARTVVKELLKVSKNAV